MFIGTNNIDKYENKAIPNYGDFPVADGHIRREKEIHFQ